MRQKHLYVGCRYLKLCHTREELGRLPQGPKLVLATLPSLQAGMARDLFVEWAADPRNLILFTQPAEVHPDHLVLMFCWWLLKHLHNVGTCFYCPQTFLYLDFRFRMTFLNLNLTFWD